MINIKHLWKGCLFSLLLAVPAWYLGKTFPLIGGPVFGILLGMIIAFWKRPHTLDEGIKFTGKQVLQYAIILLGFEMKNQTTSKTTFGDWSPNYFIFNDE